MIAVSLGQITKMVLGRERQEAHGLVNHIF